MAEEHALYSASGFYGITRCPGKLAMESTVPSTSSVYADEGTAAHRLASWVLEAQLAGELKTAQDWVGTVIEVQGTPGGPVREFEVDEKMATYVDDYVDTFMLYTNHRGAVRLIEQRVEFHDYIGVAKGEGFGTSDGVAIIENAPAIVDRSTEPPTELWPAGQNEIQVHDLKYGFLRVDAEGNEQLRLYALGALYEHGLAIEFDRVRMVIHQPRKDHTSEEVISIAELLRWAEEEGKPAVLRAKFAQELFNSNLGPDNNVARAVKALHDSTLAEDAPVLNPGDKQCKFCDAKAVCPAAKGEVRDLVTLGAATPDDFDDLTVAPAERVHQATDDELASIMDKADMIEGFIKAVRAEVERRLLRGEPVRGYKLVQGKQGNRAWTDKAAVEERFKRMRLRNDEMYKFKLISPTDAEKLLAKEKPKVWADLQATITRSPGPKSVAPMSDKRPAIEVTPVEDDFDVIEGTHTVIAQSDGVHPFRD